MREKTIFVVASTCILLAMLACLVVPVVYILARTAGTAQSSQPISLWWLVGFGAMLLLAFLFGNYRRPPYPARTVYLENTSAVAEAAMVYAAMAEARQYGRQAGGRITLITPPGFDPARLDYEAGLNWRYLEEVGPAQGITITKL